MNFVFSSRCATFGDHDNLVLNEYCTQQPFNAYGASKRAIVDTLADYQAAFG